LIDYHLKNGTPDVIKNILLELPNDYEGNLKGGLVIDYYCKVDDLDSSL